MVNLRGAVNVNPSAKIHALMSNTGTMNYTAHDGQVPPDTEEVIYGRLPT